MSVNRGRGQAVRRTVRLARRPGGAASRVYQRRERPEPAPRPADAAALGPAAPAVDDWGSIARLYDLEQPACRGAELRFWHQTAARAQAGAPGGLLELAAGSGRVAIALARKGHDVTGLELSEGMLVRARARTARLPDAARARLRWVQADMSRFDLPGERFALVFVAYNSFWLLPDVASQERCLDCVRRHLAPNGRLVLDLFPPVEDDYRDEAGIVQRVPMARRGQEVLRVKDYAYDAARQLGVSEVRYYGLAGGDGRRTNVLAQFRYALRLAPPEEVVALLRGQGFEVEATYGTYDEAPLAPQSPRAIFVARRLDAR